MSDDKSKNKLLSPYFNLVVLPWLSAVQTNSIVIYTSTI